jgi:6-phosphofructo-2-kinase/fructose-2,6-biphosphatase
MDDNEVPVIIEEGSNRVLKAGKMLGGPGGSHIAKFELPKGFGVQSLELAVSISTDPVSPFALTASWQALKKNLRPHASRRAIMGILDVFFNHQIVPVQQQQQHMHSDLLALELDLEHYEVPPPTLSSNSGIQYAANMAENPLELQHAASEPAPFYGESRRYQLLQGSNTGVSKDRSVSIKVPTPHIPMTC